MAKSTFLSFGIPSLDELFGSFKEEESVQGNRQQTGRYLSGIKIPVSENKKKEPSNSSISICIAGPDGTGKSLLGLHLASRYLADCHKSPNDKIADDDLSTILYISTDFKYEMANTVWNNFGLDFPNKRITPFSIEKYGGTKDFKAELKDCDPLGAADDNKSLAYNLTSSANTSTSANIYFVDLASNTAGDDWGFVNRILSVLTPRKGLQARHLLIIDSVEGFETLVGERDAFGEYQSRRSRIAQIMRSTGNKCHLAFIVEEPKDGERLPEEFVTDAVIRLRNSWVKDYARRTVEIEKVRGQAHKRGQHPYLIRDGQGSTTGTKENPDDCKVTITKVKTKTPQSYFHVCHSLHNLNRSIMTEPGPGRPAEPPPEYANFGIPYLDNMLAGNSNDPKQIGLRQSTVTALIGNSETQKRPLGTAFLSRCYIDFAKELVNFLSEDSNHNNNQAFSTLLEAAALNKDSEAWENWQDNWEKLCSDRKQPQLSFFRNEVGIPVLLTTQDIHAAQLASDFLNYLSVDIPELKKWKNTLKFKALKLLIENHIICRRLEIHDLPPSVLIHVIQRTIEAAQRKIEVGNAFEPLGNTMEERFKVSGKIRVVIDDFNILRNTYIEVRDEPLLLRFLLFYLGREGVTTLIIDTQPGRPDTTIPSPLDSELRSLVNNHLYTWRFPFYGEDRVAIAAMPPISEKYPTLVRELRKPTKPNSPPVVDPHFELYSGIEQGEPCPVPLKILLFNESPAFQHFIEEENQRYGRLFSPVQSDDSQPEEERNKVIVGVPALDHEKLKEFSYLQRDTRLDYTLVFQVDEFWYLRRSGLRRSGSYRQQWQYLNTIMAERPSANSIWDRKESSDPFGLFQNTEANPKADKIIRRDEFSFPDNAYDQRFLTLPGTSEENEINRETYIDRVPFMWDFGFLLCKKRAWESSKDKSVSNVWKRLPKAIKNPKTYGVRPSWKDFLNACIITAREESYRIGKPVPAFDFHSVSSETLSCLILEMWVSEIYEQVDRLPDKQKREGKKKLASLTKRLWNLSYQNASPIGLIELLDKEKSDYSTPKRIALFKVWCLLAQVLDLREICESIKNGTSRNREPNPHAIAVRHWYKTACGISRDASPSDPEIPVGLPGHFSIRGDWFLAVAGSSRSGRLADRALDLLSSRRANHNRLEQGLGLPTRKITEKGLHTGLYTTDKGDMKQKSDGKLERITRVLYSDLLKIGACGNNTHSKFHWLWRSRLKQYYRHTNIWHNWLEDTILRLGRLRFLERNEWTDGFSIYALQNEDMPSKNDTTPLGEAFRIFNQRCDDIVAQLKEAGREINTEISRNPEI